MKNLDWRFQNFKTSTLRTRFCCCRDSILFCSCSLSGKWQVCQCHLKWWNSQTGSVATSQISITLSQEMEAESVHHHQRSRCLTRSPSLPSLSSTPTVCNSKNLILLEFVTWCFVNRATSFFLKFSCIVKRCSTKFLKRAQPKNPAQELWHLL